MLTKDEIQRYYDSRRWRRLREWALMRDHYECQACIKRIADAVRDGKELSPKDRRIRHATIVHHIIEARVDPSRFYDPDNLISVCHRCHDHIHGRDAALTGHEFKSKARITKEMW